MGGHDPQTFNTAPPWIQTQPNLKPTKLNPNPNPIVSTHLLGLVPRHILESRCWKSTRHWRRQAIENLKPAWEEAKSPRSQVKPYLFDFELLEPPFINLNLHIFPIKSASDTVWDSSMFYQGSGWKGWARSYIILLARINSIVHRNLQWSMV